MTAQLIQVLLVVNDRATALTLERLLQEVALHRPIGTAPLGPVFRVQWAASLADTLEQLGRGSIDAVLLDLSLPDSQGLETFTRAHAMAPHVPIIVLTETDDDTLAIRAVRAGAQDYLIKGHVDGDLLAHSIRYAIERQRVEEVIRQHNEELDAFAHTVAHDLKNPLTTILTFANLVEEDLAAGTPGESALRYAQLISQNARKMQSIVEELLLLAGVRRTEVVAVAPLDMGSIVKEALQRLNPMIEEREAQVLLPASWPPALGYAPWMEEIWVNYVSNAIKYGGRPPRVELGARKLDNGMALFGVHDNGRGLTPEEQGRLFTPFTRLDQVSTQGHGLGLSIVRRIVEKMGGHVGVESEPGQGSTFFFTLPAVPGPS